MGDEKRYMITNLVSAIPMTKNEYRRTVDSSASKFMALPSYLKDLLSEKNTDEYGYLVKFDIDEYWMPKKLFESMSIEMIDNPSLPTAINIDERMVDNMIDTIDTMQVGKKSSIVKVVLKNGYEIIETGGTVDPLNYDKEIIENNCLKKVRLKIWDYLGFMLQTAWRGIR